MMLLKRYKSRIGSWLMLSFILQVTSPLVAAMQLQPDVLNQENLIVDATVTSIITRMVEAATQAGVEASLSQGAKTCYKKIVAGQEALPALAVWDAMPNMLDFAVESVRAARPTAQQIRPVVGPGNCEVTQLIAVINTIKNRIGDVSNSACCNTILGILGNARDILGVNISCALEDLVFTDSLVLERLEELESSLTACCNGLRIEIEELDIQIAECCEAIIEDIFESSTIILDKISTLSVAADCCDCDFFITQTPTGEPNNHPVGTPITIPGIYCLAESVTGTIEIQTSNVTVLFRGHTLTPDQGTGYGIRVDGIINAPYNNIRIEGGTIQGGTGAQPPLFVQNCTGVTIADMSFVANTGSNAQLVNVDNFIIQQCQFLQGTQYAIYLDGCSNGQIGQCQVRDFNEEIIANLMVALGCNNLLFDNIIIANNSLAAITVFFLINTQNSVLRNIRITNNTAASELIGIDCSSSDNNHIERCLINNNQIATVTGNIGLFAGIRIRSLSGLIKSNNNIISDCQINANSVAPGVGGFGLRNQDSLKKITRALTGANVFVGVEVGSDSQGGSCQNTVVENCSINGNSCIGEEDSGFNVQSLLIGVNVASVLGGRFFAVAANVGANTAIRNCSIDSNTVSSHFFGVNLASIFAGDTGAGIGANTCQNSVIENCTANNNSINGALEAGTQSFAGFSIGNVLLTSFGGSASIGSNSGANCSIAQCSVNNNNIATSASAAVHLQGILLGSIAGSQSITIGAGVCANCSISDCAVNNNIYAINNVFAGIGVAKIILSLDAIISANTGVNCAVSNCSVDFNGLAGGAIVPSRFFGISFAGIFTEASAINTVQDGVCAGSSVLNSTVNNNSIVNGFYVGINLAGAYLPASATAITVGSGVCDSCVVNGCAVDNNINNHASGVAPHTFVGINVGAVTRLEEPVGGVVTNGSCNGCAISHSSVNNNQFLVASSGDPNIPADRFFGLSFAYTPDDMVRSGNSCNDCALENIRVCKNNFDTVSLSAYMRGLIFGANNAPDAHLCNNITATRCVVEDNVFPNNGEDNSAQFIGFSAIGGDAGPAAAAICDNLTLKLCEVNDNESSFVSYGYSFVSTSTSVAYVNNLQVQNCVASLNPRFAGFNFFALRNLVVDGCATSQNTFGYLFTSVGYMTVRNCSAMSNSAAGFQINNCSSAVLEKNRAFDSFRGFDVQGGTSNCLVRDNIAQNNFVGFRVLSGGDDKLLHNFARSNNSNYVNVNPALIVDVASIQAASPNPFANVST